MNNEISVLIKGKNNEKVSDSVFILRNPETVKEPIRKLLDNKEFQVLIAEKFLELSDRRGVVNTAIGASKKTKTPPLWTPDYSGNSYYGGVVGVIEDYIKIDLNEDVYKKYLPDADITDEDKILNLFVRLQIRSRFDEEKTFFLATMLLRDDIKLNDKVVFGDEEEIYDYLLLIWYKKELLEAYQKGFYKTYRRFETNNDRIKGSIDITRHIRLNAGQSNGKLACSYRENTVNNYLNHLIIASYHHLKKKYPDLVDINIESDSDFKTIIESIRSELGVDSFESKTLIKNNNKPITHPYYMEYEDMRQVCIKILRDEGISIWNAENAQTKSILFYIPDLWEMFLEERLKGRLGVDVFSQGETPDGDKEIKVFGKHDSCLNNEFGQATYPDYVFFDMKNDKKPYMILDAKFRKNWSDSIAKSRPGDLDDYDKCIRDMNSVNAHATGVIFPVNQDDALFKDESSYTGLEMAHRISKYNQRDVFYTFPVIVPGENENEKEMTYSEWKRKFDRFANGAIEIIGAEVEKNRQSAAK